MDIRKKLVELMKVPIYPRLDADPAEVVADYLLDNGVTMQEQGRWIWKGKSKGYFCSVCGGGCLLNYESDWHESRYCPHCGAKMEVE